MLPSDSFPISIWISIWISMRYLPGRAGYQKTDCCSLARTVRGMGCEVQGFEFATSLLHELNALSDSFLSPLRAAQEALIKIGIEIGIEIENFSATQVSGLGV
jgi:hypothetical protein